MKEASHDSFVFTCWNSKEASHESANSALATDFVHFGIDDFFLLKFLSTCASKSLFFPLWRRELQIAAICGAVVRNSIVLGNSVSADRSGMAASRFLAAAAASIILVCFASESRKSHCNGCMKVANSGLAAHFFILALMIFFGKFLLKSVSKS